MLRLPPLEYVAPTDLGEVVALLGEEGTMVVAGGTDLVPNLKRRQYPGVHRIVSLNRIPGIDGVRVMEDGSVRLGALATLARVAADRRVPKVVREAAAAVASPQIRNRGTVGGNLCVDTRCHWLNVPDTWRRAAEPCLKAGGDVCWVAPAKKWCWAVSSSDLAPVMVAIGAEVTLVGPAGERTVAADELYRDDGMDHLAKDPEEVITAVTIPALDGVEAGYSKLRRRGSIDFPILGVAIALGFDGDRCRSARIVLGAVASAPVRAVAAEEFLVSEAWSEATVDRAAELAGQAVRPMSNTDLTSRYRKRMVPVFVRRLLAELGGRVGR